MHRRFNHGDVLFRQGDSSDCVLRLVSGSVEILREVGDSTIVLGQVHAGQFVGEMGVIERRPRSATARAITKIEAEQFSAVEFFQRVSADPAMAAELMLRLSVRLREIEDKITEDLPRTPIVPNDRQAHPTLQVQLAAATSALRERIGAHSTTVDQFPFVVGRRPRPGEKLPRRVPDLVLDDRSPFRLSRLHFAVVSESNRLVVRDLGSSLGTAVNGEPIGSHFRTDIAELKPGENRIVAGGFDSDFVFSALVS
jgi:CRP-like cAMP-binding protein